MKIYVGSLGYKMGPIEQKAYSCWHNMAARSKRLGLHKPEPKIREFISWYVAEQNKLRLKRPSISRYDHSKGYTWDNFRLEEMIANSLECAIRNKLNVKNICQAKKTAILDLKDNSILMICPSIHEASRCVKIASKEIRNIARGKYKTARKRHYNFKFIDNV